MPTDADSAQPPGNASSATKIDNQRRRFCVRNWLRKSAAIGLMLACVQDVRAADAYTDALDKRFSSESAASPGHDSGAAALEEGLKQQVREMSQRPEPESPAAENGIEQFFILIIGLVVAFVGGVFVVLGMRRYNQWLDRPAARLDNTNIMAEDPSMIAFLRALHEDAQAALPVMQALEPGLPAVMSVPGAQSQATQTSGPLPRSQELLVKDLAALRSNFQKLSRTSADAERSKLLTELYQIVESVKEGAGAPQLRTLRLLASALDGLLKQLAAKPSNVSPSALRTTASAIDLLEHLGAKVSRPDLAIAPAVRLLAVDDDAISRRAISIALKKTFNEPDLAPDGENALKLAVQQPYDLIFLDVEMPGMDGFELCSKIHETGPNRTTPVVFVTGHSDFESRAKSALSGAHDLIGKPFLAFEITVKALTLVLKSRLEDRGAKPVPGEQEKASVEPAAVDSTAAIEKSVASASTSHNQATTADKKMSISSHQLGATRDRQLSKETVPASTAADRAVSQSRPQADLRQPSSRDFARAFVSEAPAHLKLLQKKLEVAGAAADASERHELLSELFIGVHTICAEAGRAQLLAASRVSSALESMLKKLVERPATCTPSTLETAAAALRTLEQLCEANEDLDLAKAPVRLLVVDDDPLAQRAVSGALQLAFGRPDNANCGEAALALAGQKPYDLIFLDVIMPGMDGFITCAKLHELAPNRLTPVVFVTSQDDASSREEATASGGCGFIPKPVLPCEILLLALTHIVRGRLERQANAPWEQTAHALESDCVLAG